MTPDSGQGKIGTGGDEKGERRVHSGIAVGDVIRRLSATNKCDCESGWDVFSEQKSEAPVGTDRGAREGKLVSSCSVPRRRRKEE